MVDPALVMLCLVILAALLFDYINGFHDTANAIATSVSTRALSVKAAIIMAATLNFVGAMAFTKVAKTIGTGIASAENLTQMVVLAGVIGAIIWNVMTWYFGLPSSSSHAIVGGLIGSVFAHAGLSAIKWAGLKTIILALIFSPILGVLAGFVFVVIFSRILRFRSPAGVNRGFRKMQILSAATMAFSHGTADAQKSMGWRIIKTVGRDFVKLQPMTGFSVDASSTCVILGASMLGLPTSTTHVVTSSILGVGLSKSLNAVNWNVAKRIVTAWVLTIPAAALVAYLTYQVMSPLLGK